MGKKLLDFEANISDVVQINPLFSTCKVRVLYTGLNRNMSILTKESVEKALPTLKNIPIVGEFNVTSEDFKGHGGQIDLDSYKYIHTTKPYGVVPESATYEWEEVKGRNGVTREYLTINGCYLWTGRYEEAFSVIERGKGQSMEIEVADGRWDEEQEAYHIDNFTFSALCILGDDVEPAFEDSVITAYSFDKDSFKKEFSTMLSELKSSISDKEGNKMLKELLKKYSLTVEELTAKGIDFNEISEDELEAKIIEVFELDVDNKDDDKDENNEDDKDKDGTEKDDKGNKDEGKDPDVKDIEDGSVIVPDKGTATPENPNPKGDDTDKDDDNEDKDDEGKVDFEAELKSLQAELAKEKERADSLYDEVVELREFKVNYTKAEHEAKAKELFTNFQLTEEDVKDLDIHKFSIDEVQEKCYAILGRKLASKKNFSKNNKDDNIKLPIESNKNEDDTSDLYGGLFEKYNKKD